MQTSEIKQATNSILDIAYPSSPATDKVGELYEDCLPKALKDAAVFIFTYGSTSLTQKYKAEIAIIKNALKKLDSEGNI